MAFVCTFLFWVLSFSGISFEGSVFPVNGNCCFRRKVKSVFIKVDASFRFYNKYKEHMYPTKY